MSVLPFSVVAFRIGQPLADKVEFLFWRRYALLRFLLESVQDINRALEAHGVDGTPCIASVAGNDFKDAPSSKSLERLRRRIGIAFLRSLKSMADFRPNGRREGSHVLTG